jgi:pyruvate dehydrogenase E2 component (dihydrolipoamide acetyltransferase)
MSAQLLMPKLGLTMSEGLLLEWKVAPGEAFSKGQLLFVVETDKAATDIEAEADGVFAERLVAEGETVPVGTPVGRLAAADTGRPADSTPPQAPPAVEETPALQDPAPRTPSDTARGQRLIATPLARRVARERGINLAAVSGTGPRGRIKLADVERLVAASESCSSMPALAAAVQHRRVKPTPIQAAMARRLSQVKHGVPHFYLSTEAEISSLLDLRADLNQDTERPKLTLTHFVLAAVGRALADCPGMNRVWVDGEIIEFASTDVSMAVETENGLYVPVVHAAGSASLDQVAARARTVIDKARAGRLSAAEMEGAALAVSNAGMHDVTWLTPIINAGQSSILGIGSVREMFRPGPEGAPSLRREMGLVFSGDHRVHTGVEGLTFLNRIRTYLETPLRLLRAP